MLPRKSSILSVLPLLLLVRPASATLAADRQERLQAAQTPAASTSLFYPGLGRGMLIRFQVKSLLKRQAGDRSSPRLAAGDYQLPAYAAGYPLAPRLSAAPQAFHLSAKSCALQVLVAAEPVRP